MIAHPEPEPQLAEDENNTVSLQVLGNATSVCRRRVRQGVHRVDHSLSSLPSSSMLGLLAMDVPGGAAGIEPAAMTIEDQTAANSVTESRARPFKQVVGGQTVTDSLTLSQDIFESRNGRIMTAADDIVLDCGGHAIFGDGSGTRSSYRIRALGCRVAVLWLGGSSGSGDSALWGFLGLR